MLKAHVMLKRKYLLWSKRLLYVGTIMLVLPVGLARADLVDAATAGENAAPPIGMLDLLRTRVGPPSDVVVQTFREAGAVDVSSYDLTEDDWKSLERAIDALPALHERILRRHLRQLSFVSAPLSLGSGLTSKVEEQRGLPQFDITLSSKLFSETLTEFLNRKEKSLFEADESDHEVQIEAGHTSVLPYILLHEATHIVDQVLGWGEQERNVLREGVWRDSERSLAAPFDSNPVSNTSWRGGERVAVGKASALYQGLSATPFVSVYAASAVGEDIAETITWQQLSTRQGIGLKITVRNKEGAVLYALEPLKSPLVRGRFLLVERLLTSHPE